MILATGDEPTIVNVHPVKKIKRKRKGEVGQVSTVTEPLDKTCMIPLLKRLRLGDNTSVPFGYK